MARDEAIEVLNMVEAHGLADKAKRMAIKALEQEPKWIPVSEGFPETNDDVLWWKQCLNELYGDAVTRDFSTNIGIGVTAYARKMLCDIIEKLDDQIVYFDTDCVKFLGSDHDLDFMDEAETL